MRYHAELSPVGLSRAIGHTVTSGIGFGGVNPQNWRGGRMCELRTHLAAMEPGNFKDNLHEAMANHLAMD